jgi:hypothetical protein
MATSMKRALFLVLVVSYGMWLAVADSTISNLSTAPMTVNDNTVAAGQMITVSIASTESSAAIDIMYTRTITNVQIKNNEYFVVENQDGISAMLDGNSVTTLDLVEAAFIEQAF